METVQLTVQKRNPRHRAQYLRSTGKIPAVFYGSGVTNLSLEMDYQTFRKIFRSAGENTILDLNVEGEGNWKTLIHDVQYDPLTDNIRHVDFINVRMDQEVHTRIPLNFVGAAPAVKNLGGILNTPVLDVEVKCLPQYLVHSLTVDVGSIEDFHIVIHVKDLVVPEGITVLTNPDQTVATVNPPRAEEEPETAAPTSEGVPAEGAEAGAAPAAGEAAPAAEAKGGKKE
jgi:large subunit ribosomal protein L25